MIYQGYSKHLCFLLSNFTVNF